MFSSRPAFCCDGAGFLVSRLAREVAQAAAAGAQALAVTMRGLVLREFSLRHWPRVVFKEVNWP